MYGFVCVCARTRAHVRAGFYVCVLEFHQFVWVHNYISSHHIVVQFDM